MTPAAPAVPASGNAVGEVAAIVVTFHPDPDALRRLLWALAPQVERILLVDNSPGSAHGAPAAPENAEFIGMGDNLGLAAAQNRGIARARVLGLRHVVFFDQDSEPAPGMVRDLLQAQAQLLGQGERVAAVGPRWQDPQGGSEGGFIRVDRGGRARVCVCGGSAPPPALIRCDYLIASGCLVSLAVLEVVGPMDEGLFIDQIDIEWCLRAGRLGYACFGVCGALLHHRVGVGSRRVWFLGWRELPRNNPEREYYLARNLVAVMLWRRAPVRWCIVNAKVLATLFMAALTCDGERARRLRMGALGVLHGVCRREGRRDAPPGSRPS